jgi:hypothetical protein
MDDMKKESERDQDPGRRGPDSSKPDKNQDMEQPVTSTSSDSEADGNVRKERITNAVLSEEFFLSDPSGD